MGRPPGVTGVGPRYVWSAPRGNRPLAGWAPGCSERGRPLPVPHEQQPQPGSTIRSLTYHLPDSRCRRMAAAPERWPRESRRETSAASG